MAEDNHIVTSEAVVMRNMEGFVPSSGAHNININPRLRPVMYPVNPNMGWYAHHGMPVTSGGTVENPNFVYQVGGGGVIGDRVGGGVSENPNFAYRVGGAISDSPNLGYRVGHGIGENPNYVGGGIAENPSFVNQVGGGFGGSPTYDGRSNMSDQARSGGGFGGSASYDSRSNVSDQASDQGVDDQSSIEKVKLLCSFGGKILRRPNDGVLRHVGGHTRIISLRRNVSFQELVHKMIDVYGKPVVIKYQLPDGELDSLVSVSCTEDLDNMMDEYEKLVESSSHGSAKLRVFLFSASELDSSVLLQFSDLLDSGQRYIDAVNWISDGVGDGITRKVSIGSDGSMPNSDGPAGGSEGVDSTSYGQGDGYGISSPSTVSPRVASHDAPANLMYVSPNPVVYAPPMPVGPPTVFPSTPQTLPPLQSEPEFKRPVPSVVQPQVPLGYDLQKSSGMDFRPVTAYMPAYVDPHHHISSQVGLLNPQGVGTAGPIYRYAEPPPLVRDNVGVAHQQFIPAVPMSVASSDTHVGMKMNVAQQVIQQPQNLVDPYIGESAFRARVVQFPVEQNCPVYQTPCPPQPPTAPLQSGGGCGLMLPAQHVVLGDRRLTHQPGVLPEKLSNFEDCFMCQKALPHAHSDTVVKDPRYCSSTTASDANVVFHSAPLEDNLGTHPMSRVVVSGALGEAEYQGSRTQPRYIIQRDDSTSEAGMTGFSQDLEVEPEKDRILRIFGNPDNPGMLFSQGVMGKAVDVKSPYVRDIPHSEDALQQSPEPQLYQVQQKPLVNLPGGSDFPPLDGTSVQNIKPVVLESSKEYSGKNSDPFVKENTSKSCIHDHLTSIEGGVEGAHVSSLEQCSSPIHKHEKEDFPVSQPQIPEQETYPSSDFTNPEIIQDRNHIMPIGVMPTSSSEVAHFISSHPVDPNQITKPVMLGVSGPYLHCMGTQHRTCEELLQGVPDLSAIISDNTHMKDEASGFQSINASNTSSGNTLSPYGGIFGDKWEHSTSNSLFSNHDPWTLRHGQSFLPPKTNAAANDKVFITKEQEVLHESSGHLNQCSNSEHLQSDKDVVDEYSKQELKVAEEAGHKPSGHLNKESNPEDDHSNKDVADEYFRQELKSVAEGVADMALRSPMPNESSVHEVNESSPKVSHGRALDSGVEVHMMPKVEDVKAKLLDKESSGLPLSEGIGRLQIIKNCDLEELRELGSGTFGTVYHGKWRGSDVAIKRFSDRCFSGKPSERSRMIDDFWNEAIKLADLHHPNVVAFYGVVLDGPGDSVATVTEFMVNGSLRQALQRTLDKRKRLLIAMDVAFGMEYLHGKRIVHFDLKSDNLLVNLRDPHRPICKVGDLGLSKVKCHTLISGGVRGTLPWMAPELLNGSSSLVSEKVDVFSFGIVMWELLTGEEPYADLHYGIIIGGIVSNSLRPTVPESCDPMWKSLMERCWSSEPSERPSFTEIADQLRSMAASLPPKGQTPQ